LLESEGDWVKVILTDQVRPLDAMRSLQTRFRHAVALEHRPVNLVDAGDSSYADRIGAAATDAEIIAGFLSFVRNGVGPSEFETALVADLLTEQSTRAANS
jgi:exonuclease SbcD